MENIERDILVGVAGGGESGIKINTPLGSGSWTVTDYKACQEAMTKATAAQYPDTRPWWGQWMPWLTDENAVKRGAATAENIGKWCGIPPT